jgi:hypothetical protein
MLTGQNCLEQHKLKRFLRKEKNLHRFQVFVFILKPFFEGKSLKKGDAPRCHNPCNDTLPAASASVAIGGAALPSYIESSA